MTNIVFNIFYIDSNISQFNKGNVNSFAFIFLLLYFKKYQVRNCKLNMQIFICTM